MQDNILKSLGLVTQYSPLSIQPGALTRADNAVIDRENIVENRRGYSSYGTLPGDPNQVLSFNGTVGVQQGTSVLWDNGSGTFAAATGSYSPPSGYKMRFTEARNNLYVTTSTGVKTFSSSSGGAARLVGAPRALDPSYTLTGAAGFLANTFQCAYRCVIKRTDANNNEITGYPSQRLWVANAAGGARNVILTVYLPTEVIVGDVVQFFRTDQVTGTASDTSGDTMKLAYQQTLIAGDITAGFITVTDSIVDALLGANLYTNATEQGISQANAIPPLAKDIALYKSSFMFFANTETKQRLYVTLVGTASLTGKTITLAGTAYNFGASEIVSGGGSPQAEVSATGTAAVDIDLTARSLVRVINRYASNTAVYAYYLSGPEDLPGQILIEERGLGVAAYSVTASDSAISGMFFPAPPTSGSASASTSSNDVYENRLYYSKADEPEHVPLLNYLPAGPANSAILRIAALRDSLIIIKEDGVYRLTGDNASSFNVVPLDLTVFCKAASSVVVLQNTVMMLSNQGVVAISDTGVEVISREIEDSLKPLLQFSNLDTYTCALGYESERAFLLSTMSLSSDTEPTQIYRYNIFTRAWTRWTFGFDAAWVEPRSDRFYFTKSGYSGIYKERKDFEESDYADPKYDITIVSITADVIVFTVSGITPEVGWQMSQGGSSVPIDSLVGAGADWTATLAYEAPASWTTGAADLFPDVGFDIEWNAWTAAQPGLLKQIQQVELLADNLPGKNSTTQLIGTYQTDLDQNTEEVEIDSSSYLWGTAPWGEFPWGGVSDTYSYPTWPPQNKAYGRLFSFGVRLDRAFEHASIAGLSITYLLVSERVSK